MADTRFHWSSADTDSRVVELYKRARNPKGYTLRCLKTDANIPCVVCGKRPKRHDWCCRPARHPGPDNEIIGHQTCVEKRYAEIVGRSFEDVRLSRFSYGERTSDPTIEAVRPEQGVSARARSAQASRSTSREGSYLHLAGSGSLANLSKDELIERCLRLEREKAEAEKWREGAEAMLALLGQSGALLRPKES